MHEEEIQSADLLDEMTLDEAAVVCRVEVEWLSCRLDEGFFPGIRQQRFSMESLVRARRMRDIERDFDASPELAALFADLLEEIDDLKAGRIKNPPPFSR